MKWRKLSEFEDVHGTVWIKMKDGSEHLADFYDCQWMRDGPDYDDVEDAFSKHIDDDGNHFELVDIVGWRKATEAQIRKAEMTYEKEPGK